MRRWHRGGCRRLRCRSRGRRGLRIVHCGRGGPARRWTCLCGGGRGGIGRRCGGMINRRRRLAGIGRGMDVGRMPALGGCRRRVRGGIARCGVMVRRVGGGMRVGRTHAVGRVGWRVGSIRGVRRLRFGVSCAIGVAVGGRTGGIRGHRWGRISLRRCAVGIPRSSRQWIGSWRVGYPGPIAAVQGLAVAVYR